MVKLGGARCRTKTCSFWRPCITSCTPKFSDIPPALHIDQLLSLFLQLKQNAQKTFHLPKKNKTTHHISQVDSLCPLMIVWKCEFKTLVEMVRFWIFITDCSGNSSLNNQFWFHQPHLASTTSKVVYSSEFLLLSNLTIIPSYSFEWTPFLNRDLKKKSKHINILMQSIFHSFEIK